MRIIDKNNDFYDYLQNIYHDDTFTFDRRDSFVVTKEIMCGYLDRGNYWNRDNNRNYVLLQICNTFWLFMAYVTERDDYQRPTDYEMSLVATWKNYNKPRSLIKLDIISLGFSMDYRTLEKIQKGIIPESDVLIKFIDTNDYRIRGTIDHHDVYIGDNYKNKVEKHIPLLKACGIANCVEPLDVYLAFEEYFSLEKTASERRDPVGTTDVDRLENHGFDKKISFRGKR